MPPTTCAYKEPTSHCQCYCLAQGTILICFSVHDLAQCILVGREGLWVFVEVTPDPRIPGQDVCLVVPDNMWQP